MWDYVGFPNVTNATWADYDVHYLNPFDSCCWLREMDSWVPRIKAIKTKNPEAIVLATFHATEIWNEDLVVKNPWLPKSCLMRNAGGSLCSWWNGLVFTNNLFREECLDAAVDNAVNAFSGGLLAAGVDGVFLVSYACVRIELRDGILLPIRWHFIRQPCLVVSCLTLHECS
eukprot:SAG31_NODE_1289_length_8983_cov_9.783543_5_plen_172_part_00